MTHRIIKPKNKKKTALQGKANESCDRKMLQKKIFEDMARVRERIDPKVLKRVQNLVSFLEPADEDVVLIDRERNIKFVTDFLASPQGAHLREKMTEN